MILNGKEIILKSNITISELLLENNINNERVVVELNKEIIPKNKYSVIKLKQNDSLEVISFVGGG